ncbi:uncharacterized protein GGS25DRAFT_523064 [Hypoxylon fragiforme]|uniref:uncharacterized protein n=1 Tax=Hypoxylon fragiforme TaxID=63214 RepID=UPI0020C71888|nr:uncharacterized protein GGS25DRAFT_523064 [Hypoxylon fragiforme]KAI2607540.1 hypothetical protein GGS25DRAFT_523064 [Hypoxylon fragiforme]
MDHAARSACPALRAAAAEQNQHPPMFQSRPGHYFDPVHGNAQLWQGLPPPYLRWTLDPPYQSSPVIMPPHAGHMNQQSYLSNGPNAFSNHQHPPFNYRTHMPGLQRIGGTAPIQHTQGNLSNSSQAQPQAAINSGVGSGTGAHNSRVNNTLPSLNSMPHPTAGQNPQAPSFVQTSHTTQQPGRHSPLHSRHNSVPSTSQAMAETNTSSSGMRSEAGSSQSDSPSPARRTSTTQPPVPPSHATGIRASDYANEASLTEQRRAIAARNRRTLTRLQSSESGWSSDDDSDTDAVAMQLLEAAVGGHAGDERMRTHQVMRGALSGKRVASKKALTSLESVIISDLPDNERTCVICYNDYGVETPEGISESPLRLPKCKHVFGDHCIKKWFEESDSCPYCRDKVPSEPQYRQAVNAHNVYRFLRQHHQIHLQHMQMRSGREQERGDTDLSRPADTTFNGLSTAISANPYTDLEFGTLGSPGARRTDSMAAVYAARSPWHTNPGDRHSPLPFGEVSENRRRVRPRHGSLRGLPSARHNFGAVPPNGNSQIQQYPWLSRPSLHNRPPPVASPSAAPRPPFDSNGSYPFQTQLGGPSEPYLNPLNTANAAGTSGEYPSLSQMRSQPPLSPTYPGPDVYMTNADDYR